MASVRVKKRASTTARPIQDFKLPGSRGRLVDEASGEFNAGSKKELSQILNTLADLIQTGQVMSTRDADTHKKDYAERKQRNEMLVEAYYSDVSSNRWSNLGTAIGGELRVTADREGFLRRLFLKSDVTQGNIPRIRVRYKNVVAMIATGPSQLMPTRIEDNYLLPPEWYIKSNIRVEEREIQQGTGDILDDKFFESLEAIMVQEDRNWKRLVDATVGISNENQILSGGLDPDNLGIMRDQVSRWEIPVQTLLFASDVLSDITGTTYGSWFDPVSQYEIVLTGRIGTLLGMDLITDAYREPILKMLDQGDLYLVSSPEYHGTFTERGPVNSQAVNSYPDGEPSRGWSMYELVSMVAHNPRSIVRGQRT